MKLLAPLAFCSVCLVALAQAPSSDGFRERVRKVQELVQTARDHGLAPYDFVSQNSEVAGSNLVRMNGKAIVIFGNGVMLHADEAEYNLETGDIQAQDHVRVTTRPPVDPRALRQFGIK
jgi:lipopolysaccharide assembly outer membrane protein LptD (OstA)